MKPVAILLLLAACGQTAPDRPRAAPRSTPAREPTATQARPANLAAELAWLPRETQSVARLRPGSISVLEWLASQVGGHKPACWTAVEATVEAGYMFEVKPSRSLLGFHSTSGRGDIERCIERAFPAGHLLHATVQRDGDTSIIVTEAGRAVLWWQGDGWVVAGTPAEIDEARSAKELALDTCMQRMVARLPARPIAYSSCNRVFEGLLGVPTRGWLLGASVDRESLHAEVTVFYASAEDATRARAALTPKALPAALPESVRAWVGRLPSSVADDRLEIRVDVKTADLGKLDVSALSRSLEEPKSDDDDPLKKYWQQRKKAADEKKKKKKAR
jgi:hypothetical protein